MWKPGQIITIKKGSGFDVKGIPFPEENVVCRVHKRTKQLSSLAEFSIGIQRKTFSIIEENCPVNCYLNAINKH